MSTVQSRTRRLVILLMAILGAGQTGVAQSPTGARPVPEEWRSVEGTPQIRLKDKRGNTYVLRDPAVVDGRLTGTRSDVGVKVEYSIEEVTWIQRRGSAAGKGALIGGAVGFLGGAVALGAYAMSSSGTCYGCGIGIYQAGGGGSSDDGAIAAAVFMGGAAGALVGAGLGAAIGAPIRRWKTSYQAPRVTPMATGQRVGLQLSF